MTEYRAQYPSPDYQVMRFPQFPDSFLFTCEELALLSESYTVEAIPIDSDREREEDERILIQLCAVRTQNGHALVVQ